MSHCRHGLDPIDAALHAWGMCLCALYSPRPPRPPWSRADIDTLLGVMGWELRPAPQGGWYGYDPARELFVPNPHGEAGEDAAHLDELVVRCACARALAGPMTVAEARAILTPLGIDLHGGHRGSRGWRWQAHHPMNDWRSLAYFSLSEVVAVSQRYLHGLQTARNQPVLTQLTAQAEPSAQRTTQRHTSARPRLATTIIGNGGRRTRSQLSPPSAAPTQPTLDLFNGSTRPSPDRTKPATPEAHQDTHER
ncbi:MAG: hypothetical protein EI684_21450 [Candidatus Viridilinea halotolerans]|uniref:Uncharacterized protein n=1 Tax=Candidatus Viridilinea halotolerans TaxID=2491704 RepID=A0A426TRF5_9CHLR|nr:MAG: hypothetical protein EI684_21450 [Candidatus Viridilinea halotolerans]